MPARAALPRGFGDIRNVLVALVHLLRAFRAKPIPCRIRCGSRRSRQAVRPLRRSSGREIGGRLKRPLETARPSRRNPAAIATARCTSTRKFESTSATSSRLCARTRAGHFVDDAVDLVRIEAPVVEHHVGAVIARIGTAGAGGVRQLASAAGAFIGVEIDQVVCGRRKGGERRRRPVRILDGCARRA